MTPLVKIASGAEALAYNAEWLEQVQHGNVKEAAVSAEAFTRNELREGSFTEHILTPIHITNDELDKTSDPHVQVKWTDREPDAAIGAAVPYGVVPEGVTFKGDRYPTYFGRIQSKRRQLDYDLLRTYDYDIRQVITEIDTKHMATLIDTKLIETVTENIGSANTANPANGRGLPQWIQISGGMTRDNIKEAFKYIQRLKVPFGPGQPDGERSVGKILANNVDSGELNGLLRSEVGDDETKRTWVEGLPTGRVLGVPTIYTMKEALVPEGTMFFFSSEDFLGKYFKLHDLTMYLKNEAYFLEWFQYMNLGISIGNIRGVIRVDFV